MTDFATLMPRSEQVLVGKTTLVVEEYTGAKRDAIISVLLAGLDIVTLAEPVVAAIKFARENKKETIDLDLSDLIVKLEGSIKNILTRDLSQVMCITLDTKENRQKVGVKKTDLTENKTNHFKFNQEMWTWIKNQVTMRQEPAILTAILEVNDFADLVKKYLTLVSKAKPEAGEKA